ncbi:PLP-dependent aminotransferase family protein [Streptomyces sp. NBC_01485]|uniref:aminotransferase-like domain-containing protein n=1 Tax=Streptomyces sp. NBC_01485 TaxID=2903884 RepID=UPI002E3328C6|nr:PLP-dependent aminotransferase family protein [Streptomyces sp. NBC_01485]
MELSDLNAALGDPLLESMTFLNEVAGRHPDAVSFAAGRPTEDFFDVRDLTRHLHRYQEFLSSQPGLSDHDVMRTLFQYGRTKGVIHELVARHLAVDEDIDADPESIVITVGAQEAMYLALRVLCRDERDVALAVSPTYMGFSGAAKLVGMPVLRVASGDLGVDFDDLRARLREARARGLRPRCLYVVPDFSNPTGISLDLATRRRLIEVAEDEDILLIEDNPYGLFTGTGHGERLPTLKALDRTQRVLYLGSFAKTTLPGARVGFMVADQRVTSGGGAAGGGAAGYLADELAKIKSMVTVNTSPLAQAVVAGQLLEHDYSLVRANAGAIGVYRRNLDLVLNGLRSRFAQDGSQDSSQDSDVRRIHWNTPTGGFFVVLTLPFPADEALLERSAREHGVLWTPMRHFYDGAGGGENQLRLSCSLLTPEEIETGLDRLADLLTRRLSELNLARPVGLPA